MCAASLSCDQEFSSRMAREGTFSSPDYPNPHPGDITCRYRFHGHGRERVQIIFTDFDLNTPSASMPTKTKSDFTRLYHTPFTRWNWLDEIAWQALDEPAISSFKRCIIANIYKAGEMSALSRLAFVVSASSCKRGINGIFREMFAVPISSLWETSRVKTSSLHRGQNGRISS